MDHAEADAGRDAGVDGISPGVEDPVRRQRRQRVTRGDRIMGAQGIRAQGMRRGSRAGQRLGPARRATPLEAEASVSTRRSIGIDGHRVAIGAVPSEENWPMAAQTARGGQSKIQIGVLTRKSGGC